MAKVRLRIDGDTVFNGDAGAWEHRAPDVFKDAIRPGAAIAPWLKAVAVTMSDALMTNGSMKINVRTKPGGWVMEVSQ